MSFLNDVSLKNPSSMNKLNSDREVIDSTTQCMLDVLVHAIKFLDLPVSKILDSVLLPNAHNHLHRPSPELEMPASQV